MTQTRDTRVQIRVFQEQREKNSKRSKPKILLERSMNEQLGPMRVQKRKTSQYLESQMKRDVLCHNPRELRTELGTMNEFRYLYTELAAEGFGC